MTYRYHHAHGHMFMTAGMYGGSTSGNDRRWKTVLDRDASHDGVFVYAVTSTGVYCRPSCPSRRPARHRVRFYPDPRSAEQAGFRACRRCDPATSAPAPTIRRVLEARAYLDAHPDERITLGRLARTVGLSASYLQRRFTAIVGMSPSAYANARRHDRLRQELRANTTVARATYAAGYTSGNRPYDRRSGLGMTPAAYRRGGEGMTIRYTIIDTPIGTALVAATDRGLCAVTLGDGARPLVEALEEEFPNATLTRADAELADWAADVRRLATSDIATTSLPLDVAGTPFQWRVWERLRKIPRGETRSYTEIAAMIGRPTAVRAVARACAGNQVALVIPCHRVVRSDGTLGGYRWGIERKRALLDRERDGEP